MPKTTVLVPTRNPKTGEPLAAGAEVDLDDDAYNFLRQAGAVAASEQETKENTRDPDETTGIGYKEGPGTGKGNYTARTGREDVSGSAAPAPRAAADEPPKKK